MKTKNRIFVYFLMVFIFFLSACNQEGGPVNSEPAGPRSAKNVSLKETEKLMVINIVTLPDGSHIYYHELLQTALDAIGQDFQIKTLRSAPQKRIQAMLDQGEITLYWLVQSKDRDQKYVLVEPGITNSLIGHRVLFIPRGRQSDYDGVQTLADFRKLGLVGAFGKDWFDVRVWKIGRAHV